MKCNYCLDITSFENHVFVHEYGRRTEEEI